MCSNCGNKAGMWDDLEEDLNFAAAPKTSAKVEETFPCISCSGTGKWVGGSAWNPTVRECFSCGGSGRRKMTAAEQANRKRGAQKAKHTAANNLRKNQEALRENEGELLNAIREMTEWNDFAKSLMDQFNERGKWSENQIAAAKRMVEKVRVTREAKRAERQANLPDVGSMTKIKDLFDKALERGLNKRALIFAGPDGEKIKLTPAKAPRTEIWVKMDGEFIGGIKDGKWNSRIAAPWVAELLTAVAKDPTGQARLFGQKTGICCCCGRELTDPISVEAGIGPICAEKWGL